MSQQDIHICNKEKEIATMQTDTSWMKKETASMSEKIDKIHDILTKRETNIDALNKIVYGNGKKGLLEKVDLLEKTKDELLGSVSAMKTFAGVMSVIVMILTAINFFR